MSSSDTFILMPDQTYNNISLEKSGENSESESDDSDGSATEYLKEMETILRKIRRKRVFNSTGDHLIFFGKTF